MTNSSENLIRINIDLNGLMGSLNRSLQKTTIRVSAGLQNIDNINCRNINVPSNMGMHISEDMLKSKEDIIIDYREWVLSNGLRDAIEATSILLEEIYAIISIWGLLKVSDKVISVPLVKWNKGIIEKKRKFHRYGVPDKINIIKNDHGVHLDDEIINHILSINKIRNCLVHRFGILGKEDVGNNNYLRVSWRRIQLILENENGRTKVVFGEKISGESTLLMQICDECKDFSIGDRIVFSVEEFSEICFTLNLFGLDATKKMNEFGIANGMLKKTE